MKKTLILFILAVSAVVFFSSTAQAVTTNKYDGYVVLQTESHGELWYVSPTNHQRYYLGSAYDLWQVIKQSAKAMTSRNLTKIPLANTVWSGTDIDGDGLPDNLEKSLGTNLNKADTDGDGYLDRQELIYGYSPLNNKKNARLGINMSLAKANTGKFWLQTDNASQAWYIYPKYNNRYYLSTPTEAWRILTDLALGITNSDLNKIKIAATSAVPVIKPVTATTTAGPTINIQPTAWHWPTVRVANLFYGQGFYSDPSLGLWLDDNVDLTFGNSEPALRDMLDVKSRREDKIKTLYYTLLFGIHSQPATASFQAARLNSLINFAKSNPLLCPLGEDSFYLHYADNTGLKDQVNDGIDNILGYPLGTAGDLKTARVIQFAWEPNYYIFNYRSDCFKQWLKSDITSAVQKPYSGIFIDVANYLPYEAVSGGRLVEYDNSTITQAKQEYQDDYVRLLSWLKQQLPSMVMMGNTSNYTDDFTRRIGETLDGEYKENFLTKESTREVLDYSTDLVKAGKTVVLVSPRISKPYTSAEALYYLSMYLAVKQDPQVYYSGEFDYPKTQWFRALEIAYGNPLDSQTKLAQSGCFTAPTTIDTTIYPNYNYAYRIYQREYDNALVLVRPAAAWDNWDGVNQTACDSAQNGGRNWNWNLEDTTDATAVTYDLGASTYYRLNADGTCSGPVSGQISIRNAEGVILLKSQTYCKY